MKRLFLLFLLVVGLVGVSAAPASAGRSWAKAQMAVGVNANVAFMEENGEKFVGSNCLAFTKAGFKNKVRTVSCHLKAFSPGQDPVTINSKYSDTYQGVQRTLLEHPQYPAVCGVTYFTVATVGSMNGGYLTRVSPKVKRIC